MLVAVVGKMHATTVILRARLDIYIDRLVEQLIAVVMPTSFLAYTYGTYVPTVGLERLLKA